MTQLIIDSIMLIPRRARVAKETWWSRLTKRFAAKPSEEERVLDWWPSMDFGGTSYLLGSPAHGYPDREEDNSSQFTLAINTMYKANSFVFTVMDFRASVFSQIDFVYKKKSTKNNKRPRPGDLITGKGLELLSKPWPGGTTSDLLYRMIQDVDLCGNAFVVRRNKNRLQRLRPDCVTVLFGSKMDRDNPRLAPDAEVVGYIYEPLENPQNIEVYLPEEMCHWAPIPDPDLTALGLSWLVPLYRDVNTDGALQTHISSYLRNGANPGTVLTLDPSVNEEKARRFLTMFEQRHAGSTNAYKTLILGGGAREVAKISADLQSLNVNHLTSMTETRIAMAGGVHPMILGTESALKHGSFNAIQAARRLFADRTMRPLWESLVQALEPIVDVQAGTTLWYDDTSVAFLREDTTDRVKNMQTLAITIRQLIDSGWEPETVKEAVNTENFDVLTHTDLYSVQLRPPLTGEEDPNSFPTSSAPAGPVSSATPKPKPDQKKPTETAEPKKPRNSSDNGSRFETITYSEIRARRMSAENDLLEQEIRNRKLRLELQELEASQEESDE
jgi:HK97 family phage portal protein